MPHQEHLNKLHSSLENDGSSQYKKGIMACIFALTRLL